MIERTTLVPAITRNRQLPIEEIKDLNLPLIFQDNHVLIERSLTGWKLKTPIQIEFKKILDTKEKGLVDYIIRSCLNERPNLIPFIFDNQSMLKMARHFLRHLSRSNRSCLIYSANLKKYSTWLGYSPDLIIQDVKPVGAIPDPLKVQNHCGFLNDYLAEIQDNGGQPTYVSNLIKSVKTFYHVNGIDVKLNEHLPRKTVYKDRAPKPEELAKLLDKAATRDALIVSLFATGGFQRRNLSATKILSHKRRFRSNPSAHSHSCRSRDHQGQIS